MEAVESTIKKVKDVLSALESLGVYSVHASYVDPTKKLKLPKPTIGVEELNDIFEGISSSLYEISYNMSGLEMDLYSLEEFSKSYTGEILDSPNTIEQIKNENKET